MSNTNYPEVVYWLALINESGLKLNLTKPIIQRWCVIEHRPLADLFSLPPLDLSNTFGLSDTDTKKIIATTDHLNKQASTLSQWQKEGHNPLICTNPRYPQRLIYNLPPAKHPLILWTRGPVDLLNKPAVTMLGSQTPNDATAEFVKELMTTLEAEAIGLVSGYGRGLDRITLDTMQSTDNGFGVAVIPMGLNAFAKTTKKLETAIQAGRIALVSPFSPNTPFNQKLADARNLLIDHMTLALLIPESDDDTQDRAVSALERGLPVFVKANTNANRILLDQGALLLTDSGEVVEWVQQALVDAAMQDDETEQTTIDTAAIPLTATAPTDPPASNDNYALRSEEIDPLDSDEALEVLSLGGEIPEILRSRLKKSEDDGLE